MPARLALLPLFLLCAPLCADERPPPAPLSFSLKPTAGVLLLQGTSKLPHGTRLAATLRFGGRPLGWRKVYLLKGRFSFRLPRRNLPPGRYEVLVRYQRRGQLPQLSPRLAKFPKIVEVIQPWQLGTPLQAVTSRLVELQLMQAVILKLAPQLTELGQLGETHQALLEGKKYEATTAQKAYDRWLAQLSALGKPAAEQAKKQPVAYRPAELDQLRNLLNKADQRARGAMRAELEQASMKVPRRFWPVNKLVRDATMLDPYLKRKVPEFTEAISGLIKQALAEKKKLEQKR